MGEENMNVNIYIKYRLHGNFSGKGKAVALLEYIDSKNNIHTRIVAAEQTGTKNELLLTILIKSLTLLKPCRATCYIEDAYIKGILTRNLLEKWEQNEWRKATGKKPSHLSLWKQLYNLLGSHEVILKGSRPDYEEELTSLLERTSNGTER